MQVYKKWLKDIGLWRNKLVIFTPNLKANLDDFMIQLTTILEVEMRHGETFMVQQNKNLLKVVHQHNNQMNDVHNEVGSINTKVSCLRGSNDRIYSSIDCLGSMVIELID